jgi:hypothetical protein
MKNGKTLSLTARLCIGASLLLLIPGLIAGFLYTGIVRKEAQAIVLDQMTERITWRRDQIASQLDGLWKEVQALSQEIDAANPIKLRDRLTLISQVDRRFSWIGFADVEGKVLVSSNGMLEGANVAKRPWFASGLNGPFAGDVHEAVLLQNLLPKRDEPYRFIDFAAPVKTADGRTAGVLGAHLDWKSVKDTIDSFTSVGVDTMLISQNRQVLHGPASVTGQELAGGAAVAATAGSQVSRIERWVDGKDYFIVTLPLSTAQSPSFGWSLLMRRDGATLSAHMDALTQSYLLIVGGATLASLLLIYLLIYVNARPVSRNAEFATDLASTQNAGIPPEPIGCEEAAKLAVALTKLQSLLSKDPGGRLRRVS